MNGDVAAVAGHPHGIVEQPAPDAVDHRAARARTGAERHAAAAFPDAQANVRAIDDPHEMDVGFLRKQRMCFDRRAECGDVERVGIVDEERAVRIAHAAGGRRARQRQRERVGGFGEGYVLPAEPRRAHLDLDQPVRILRTMQAPAIRAQHDRRRAGLPHQLPCDAARRAAAGIERRAVGIPERDAGGRVVAVRDHRELVEADAAMPIAHAPHEVAVDGMRAIVFPTAQVDDDEVIAIRVHLLKCDRHGDSGMEAGKYCTWLAGRGQSSPDVGLHKFVPTTSPPIGRLGDFGNNLFGQKFA